MSDNMKMAICGLASAGIHYLLIMNTKKKTGRVRIHVGQLFISWIVVGILMAFILGPILRQF
jgi:hypothetical protein